MSPIAQCIALARKQILLQWRSRARFGSVLMFGVTSLLIFSFAVGPDSTALKAHAAGYLWLGLLLISTLSLQEAARLDVQNGALEALVLLPVDGRALYYAKAIVNTLTLGGLGTLLIPVVVALYDAPMKEGPLMLLAVVWLGSAALVAPGTLYAVLTSRARAGDVLLPLLLFPLVVPALLGAVKATEVVMAGDPMGRLSSWIGLIVAFDAIYWSLCGLLYPLLLED
jgi:heme exporter protein B